MTNKLLVAEMDQSVKDILILIKEDRNYLENNEEIDNQKRVELIAHIKKIYGMYQSLAEHCEQLNEKSCTSLLPELQMQGPYSSEYSSQQSLPLLHSDQKEGSHRPSHQNLEVSFSSGGSSLLSLKESGEFSSSSSDSESESINNYVSPTVANNGHSGLNKKLTEEYELPSSKETVQFAEQDNKNGMLQVVDQRSYNLLLDRIIRAEKELKVSNLKLQFSEDEVTRLKNELEKNEAVALVAESVQAQLESTQKNVEEKEADLQVEKKRVLELQEHMAQLEIVVADSNSKIERLVEELGVTRGRLRGSEEENAKLKHELNNTISAHAIEISESEDALRVAHDQFSYEKTQIQSDMLRQCEVEKVEMRNLHIVRETNLQGEIGRLTEGLSERGEMLEALNIDFDELKLKYDILMTEKDEAAATIHTLVADLSSRDNQIGEMEGHLNRLRIENFGLMAGSDSLQRLIDELRPRIEELQVEVNRQRVVIMDRAEEKREAIRQLCFSLEHYRSGYQELRQVFTGNKQRAVVAS